MEGGVSRRVHSARSEMLCESEATIEEGDLIYEKFRPQDGSEVYYAVSDYAAVEESQVRSMHMHGPIQN